MGQLRSGEAHSTRGDLPVGACIVVLVLFGCLPGSPVRPAGLLPEAVAGTDAAETVTPAARWKRAIANDRVEQFSALLQADTGSPGSALASLTDGMGRNALMVACKHGELPLARQLHRLGADIAARTPTGGSAFMFAVLGNQRACAHWLLSEGADILASGSNGWSAAMIAAAKGHAPLLDWLIASGADIDRPDVYGFTPLMRAVDNRHAAAVDVLLAVSGIDLDAQNEAGNTALHHAVVAGDEVLIATLVRRGARADVSNRSGQSPLSLAADSASISALLRLPARRRPAAR